MRLPGAIESFVYQSKPSRFIAVVVVLSLVKTGLWCMPNLETSWVVSLNPFRNPFSDPLAHYLVWNWLSPFLAWRLRIHNEQSFLYFHLLFSIAFTCIFLALMWSRLEARDARTALVLFAALPVSTTAYFWIGTDSVSLVLMALLLVVRRHAWLALPIGVLLGMQHFEHGLVAFGALVLAWLVSRIMKTSSEYSLAWATAALAGVILGKIVLVILFRHYGMQVNSGRLYLLQNYSRQCVSAFYYRWQYIVWSVFGVGWIAVAKYSEQGKAAVPFLIVLAALMFLLPLVQDETRVLAIVSFPLVAAYLLLNASFLQSLSGRLVAAIFALWVVIPYPWVWRGVPRVSVFPYDVAYILHRLFGWVHVPANQYLWPF